MKRSDLASSTYPDLKLKKIKVDTEEEAMMSGGPEPEPSEQSSFIDVDEEEEEGRGFVDNLDENLLYEILKHVDARSLAMAGCVSKLWHKTAQDERLWELICTRHWANNRCSSLQLRSVVLALGGFRRLHSLYLWPLSKPAQPQQQPRLATPYSMMMTPASPAPVGAVKSSSSSSRSAQLGKDEVQLSLSLFSIRYFEKMNFTGRGK